MWVDRCVPGVFENNNDPVPVLLKNIYQSVWDSSWNDFPRALICIENSCRAEFKGGGGAELIRPEIKDHLFLTSGRARRAEGGRVHSGGCIRRAHEAESRRVDCRHDPGMWS